MERRGGGAERSGRESQTTEVEHRLRTETEPDHVDMKDTLRRHTKLAAMMMRLQ